MPPGRAVPARPQKEPIFAQISSFLGFFVYLLILKSFFLPLFIIPTGSMAETLAGEYSAHTCPNCGTEYPVGMPLRWPVVQCPNGRGREYRGADQELRRVRDRAGIDAPLRQPVRSRAGDRIMVHGWTHDLGGPFAPQRWDVMVFKVPTDGLTNYIKRLIGKPGETVEIIGGDIFITDSKTGRTEIARKPPQAQQSLWFPYYDQDHPPARPGAGGSFHPRWVALSEPSGWSELGSRRPRFDGLGGRSGEIQFVTDPGQTYAPGLVQDVYGYNGVPDGYLGVPDGYQYNTVTDVRLSCEVTLVAAEPDGFVELNATTRGDRFFVRLSPKRVTLEHATDSRPERELWGQAEIDALRGPVHVALSNVDHTVSVEIDGRTVIASTTEQYDIDSETARARASDPRPPRLAIAAQNVRARLAHVRIERDVYYTSNVRVGPDDRPGYGTQGHPVKLGKNDYLLLGDNSPQSLDCRFAFSQRQADPVGPHLRQAYERGAYQLGTVPADQLIGPAFLVYWPGTDALLPDQYLPRWLGWLNQLPGPGRIRWIH